VRVWILMMLARPWRLGQSQPPDTLQRCRSMLNDASHTGIRTFRIGVAQALSLWA